MREILFRAKRLDNGEWVEGYYLKCPHQYSGFLADHISVSKYDEEEESSIEHIYPVDPETVCQYTGLTDRNESKIWENDIVEILQEDGYFKIEWREDTASFVMNNDSFTVTFDNYWGHEMEVIDNIFDNPELLKEGVE